MNRGQLASCDDGLPSIVPHDAVVVAVIGDEPAARLLDEEESALGQVADVRRREYTIARHCARRALARLGIPPAPILSGPNREPLWPRDVVGSLTHCPGFCAAAVARRGRIISIGIDAEPHAPLPQDVLPMIASAGESELLAALPPNDVAWDRLMFSAKESVYKAWFPLTSNWLDFKHVAMTIDPAAATFAARLLVPGPSVDGHTLSEIRGRFVVDAHFIVTAAVIETAAPR